MAYCRSEPCSVQSHGLLITRYHCGPSELIVNGMLQRSARGRLAVDDVHDLRRAGRSAHPVEQLALVGVH